MRFHLLIAVLLLTTFSKAQQPFVQVQKSILIDREEFVRFGYLPKPTTVTTAIDRQPFSSKEEIESFVSNIISEHRADLPGAISSWIGQNLSSYDDGALIFIRHGFDLDKLFSNKHESIAKEYDEVCAKYNDAIGDLNTFRKDYDTLTANYRANQQKISSLESEIGELQEKSQTKTIKNQIASKQKEKTAVVLANEALIPRLNQLRSLIESHSKDAQTFFAEMKTLQKNYDEAKKFIIEDTGQAHQDILAMENYEWSDYLLNKRNIMLVVVGGSNTFKNYEVQITNRKKKYQEELTDLMQIVQYSGIPVPPSFDEKLLEGCEPAAGEPVKVPVTFVLIKRSRVDPPSSIELVQNKTVKHNLASIHEKSFVGIKVGVSLLSVDQKQFLIGANNKLNIEPDSLDAEEIKLNMMAMLEIYPFGRDYDRLKPFWEGDNIPFYERLGIVGGVKISKDPLETLFVGGSFAASRTFNLTAGIAFNKVAKNVDSLEVGINTSLEYLRRNVGKEYVPSFFAGISVSPGQLFKVLGITKKD